MIKAWLGWAVLSAILGALTVIISSVLVKTTPAPIVALFRGIGILSVSVAGIIAAYSLRDALEAVGSSLQTWVLLVLLGLTSAGGVLSFYAALKLSDIDSSDEVITAINYSSLVLIAVLNIMLGREIFSIQVLIGISLVFIGLAVLALR